MKYLLPVLIVAVVVSQAMMWHSLGAGAYDGSSRIITPVSRG